MPSDVLEQTSQIVTLTDKAKEIVVSAHANEDNPDSLALWLEVRGDQDGAFVYDLYFQSLADVSKDDVVQEDVLSIVIPKDSVEKLRGARLEWSDEGEGGLVLVNPNSPPESIGSGGVPDEIRALGLDGPMATQAIRILESEVNPSIASHGGRADLVGVNEDEKILYVQLSGGCQGCAMSRMTLTQGIETALRDGIQGIKQIVDVTDHAQGDSPYY